MPKKVKVKFVQRNVGMNRAGICLHLGRFEVADHINGSRIAGDADSRTRWHAHRQIDAILFRARAYNDVDICTFDGRLNVIRVHGNAVRRRADCYFFQVAAC